MSTLDVQLSLLHIDADNALDRHPAGQPQTFLCNGCRCPDAEVMCDLLEPFGNQLEVRPGAGGQAEHPNKLVVNIPAHFTRCIQSILLVMVQMQGNITELDKQLRLNALPFGATFVFFCSVVLKSAGIVPQVSLSLPAL